MATTGTKHGPGPAKYNITQKSNGFLMDASKSSQKSSFAQGKRILGEPNPGIEY